MLRRSNVSGNYISCQTYSLSVAIIRSGPNVLNQMCLEATGTAVNVVVLGIRNLETYTYIYSDRITWLSNQWKNKQVLRSFASWTNSEPGTRTMSELAPRLHQLGICKLLKSLQTSYNTLNPNLFSRLSPRPVWLQVTTWHTCVYFCLPGVLVSKSHSKLIISWAVKSHLVTYTKLTQAWKPN